MADGDGWPAEGGGDAADGPEDGWEPAEDCPVVALGRRSGRYWFLAPDGELRELAPRGMSGVEILSLFAGDDSWLIAELPPENKADRYAWSVTKAQRYLLRACHRAGTFVPDRMIRGPGVWVDPKSGGLVVHSGDRLWRVDPAAGAVSDLGRAGVRIGEHVYPVAPAETPPAREAATAAEAVAVLETMRLWRWRAPGGAERLLFGWVAAAGGAGALQWRPHILVTGGRGTGKSTLINWIREDLLGSVALKMSASTEAGVRQELDSAARALFLDEIENDDLERSKAVMRLSRLGSSEGQGASFRGGTDGKSKGWLIRASFFFSAILFPRMSSQDQSRISVLELDPLPTGMMADDLSPSDQLRASLDAVRGAGPRLRRRMLDGWHRFQVNLERFGHAAAQLGVTGRTGDQIGTMLAAGETLLSDEPIAPDKALALMSEFVSEPELVGHADESDETAALDHLLSCSVPVHWPNEGTSRMTVAELLTERAHAAERALRTHGIAVQVDPGPKGQVWIAVANQHATLGPLFRDTQWAEVWKTALRRIHGAKASPDKVSFAGRKVRATMIPWEAVFDTAWTGDRAGRDLPADL